MASQASLSYRIAHGAAVVRQKFFQLSFREKALILVFLIALLGIWLSNQMERHDSVWTRIGSARSDAETLQLWLDQQTDTEALFNASVANINFEDLPSRDEVNGQLDGLIRRHGFSTFSMNEPKSDFGAPLTFHSFVLNLQKADYGNLIKFVDELKKTFPYVSLRRIAIKAQSNPQFLNVTLELKSIEYTP